MKNQNWKSKFRASSAWKKFRHLMNVLQKGKDPITLKKLYKGFNIHHLILTDNPVIYKDLSDKDNFIALNKMTHENLHWCYDYAKKDPDFMNRLTYYVNIMLEKNKG